MIQHYFNFLGDDPDSDSHQQGRNMYAQATVNLSSDRDWQRPKIRSVKTTFPLKMFTMSNHNTESSIFINI